MDRSLAKGRVKGITAAFILVCSCLCAVPLEAEQATRLYFRSNSLGMPLEAIPVYQSDEYEYVLERSKDDGEIVERLYRDDVLLRTAVYQVKGSSVYGRFYEGDELQRETIEMDDRLIEEIIYEEIGRSVRKYGWQDGNLEYIETILPDGTAEKRIYLRDESGRLLEIIEEKASPTDSSAVSGFRYHHGRNGVSQWHVDASGCMHFIYRDLEGARRIREKYCGGQLIAKREELAVEDGTEITVTRPGDEFISRALHDTEGNMLSRTIREENRRITEEYGYQNDLLVKKTVRTGGSVQVTEYAYRSTEGEEAELSGTEEYEDGLLSRKTEYSENGRKKIILYRKGKPVVELIYKDEELISRESLIGTVLQ